MSNQDKVRVRGVTIHRPLIYGNTATALPQRERDKLPSPEHTHRWTVAVRSAASDPDSGVVGGLDDISHFIKRVSFKLHETYPNPTRTIDKPPFEVTETGWGEFEIHVRITFVAESAEKAISFYHHLKLHPWTATGDPEIPPLETAIAMGPVHSWQYDEVVFHDPYQSFYNLLTLNPPTPLPKVRRRPVPFHSSVPGSFEASKGGVPEFTDSMEKEESERLETARKAVIAEQDRLRMSLIEKEKELAKLQKMFG